MSSPTCFWTLLSQRDLTFIYLSPKLSRALGQQESHSLLDTSLFDYIHPDEREFARRDFFNFVNKKTVYGSITRCQYNSIPAIRRKLLSRLDLQKAQFKTSTIPQANLLKHYDPTIKFSTASGQNSHYTFLHNNPENFTTATPSNFPGGSNTIVNDQEYVIMDIGMNVVSQDIVLACFHSDDVQLSTDNHNSFSHSCGELNFAQKETEKLSELLHNARNASTKMETPPISPIPSIFPSPDRIFQIFDRKTKNLTFTWPDPNLITSSNPAYDKDDFSRLIHDEIGFCRQIESVSIPYGDLIFACFQIIPPISLGAPNEYLKPRPHSAPCSPTAISSSCGVGTKRLRSPGSLSPPIRIYSKNSHISDFLLDGENRDSKRRAIDSNSGNSPQRIAPISLPNPLMNLVSPIFSPQLIPTQQEQPQQYPFPPIVHTNEQHTQQQQQQQQQQQSAPITPFILSNSSQSSQELHGRQQVYRLNISQSGSIQDTRHNTTSPTQTSSPPSRISSSNSHPIRPYGGSTANYVGRVRNNNLNNAAPKVCESCKTNSSPEWRRGPTGHKTLCNACGLRHSRSIARETRKREQVEQREEREREIRVQGRPTSMMIQPVEPFQYP
ncbi:hypothetical protein G9A89_003469 [Geosiphon pyriformis]|nr:hypothetical protein G9A89_003469 [Geosiphon pyriformis]